MPKTRRFVSKANKQWSKTTYADFWALLGDDGRDSAVRMPTYS